MASAHVARCRLALARPRDAPGPRASTSPAASISRDAPRVRSRRAVVMATPASLVRCENRRGNDASRFTSPSRWNAVRRIVGVRRDAARDGGVPRVVTKASVVTFTDVYYDTPDAALAAKDTWLRARSGAWEIKVPLRGETSDAQGRERSVFREVEGAGPCLRELNTALGADPEDGSGSHGDRRRGRARGDHDRARRRPAAEFTTSSQPRSSWTARPWTWTPRRSGTRCARSRCCAPTRRRSPDAEAKIDTWRSVSG